MRAHKLGSSMVVGFSVVVFLQRARWASAEQKGGSVQKARG